MIRQMKALFDLGHVHATPGAMAALESSQQKPAEFLDRHATGDWGELDEHDTQANELALADGSRILSAYVTTEGERVWIITDATDDDGKRLSTCIMLPEEY